MIGWILSGIYAGFYYWRDKYIHAKSKIYNLYRKSNINFNLGMTNLYNLKILITNITIKLINF